MAGTHNKDKTVQCSDTDIASVKADETPQKTTTIKFADVEEVEKDEFEFTATEITGVFRHIGKVIPYFRDLRHVLLFKLDVMLLAWMFLAGIMKVRYHLSIASFRRTEN